MLFISGYKAVESLDSRYIQQFPRLLLFYNYPLWELMDTQIHISLCINVIFPRPHLYPSSGNGDANCVSCTGNFKNFPQTNTGYSYFKEDLL